MSENPVMKAPTQATLPLPPPALADPFTLGPFAFVACGCDPRDAATSSHPDRVFFDSATSIVTTRKEAQLD
jgi:hypothetical protein